MNLSKRPPTCYEAQKTLNGSLNLFPSSKKEKESKRIWPSETHILGARLERLPVLAKNRQKNSKAHQPINKRCAAFSMWRYRQARTIKACSIWLLVAAHQWWASLRLQGKRWLYVYRSTPIPLLIPPSRIAIRLNCARVFQRGEKKTCNLILAHDIKEAKPLRQFEPFVMFEVYYMKHIW